MRDQIAYWVGGLSDTAWTFLVGAFGIAIGLLVGSLIWG